MISEHDRVVLTEALPEAGLEKGDVGTVVHVYQNTAAYEVEFVTLAGTTAAVVTVPAAGVRSVSATEIPHAREAVLR